MKDYETVLETLRECFGTGRCDLCPAAEHDVSATECRKKAVQAGICAIRELLVENRRQEAIIQIYKNLVNIAINTFVNSMADMKLQAEEEVQG